MSVTSPHPIDDRHPCLSPARSSRKPATLSNEVDAYCSRRRDHRNHISIISTLPLFNAMYTIVLSSYNSHSIDCLFILIILRTTDVSAVLDSCVAHHTCSVEEPGSPMLASPQTKANATRDNKTGVVFPQISLGVLLVTESSC